MLKVPLNALVERLTPFCLQQLQRTAATSAERTHYEVDIEHLLLSFCREETGDIPLILRHFGIEPEALALLIEHALAELPKGHSGRPAMSPLLVELIQDAWLTTTIELQGQLIRSGALLLAILGSPAEACHGQYASVLRTIPRERLLSGIATITAESVENEVQSLPGSAAFSPQGSADESGLARFCSDLTAAAEAGQMDPVLGRDREMRQIIDILARRKKNNPILVGDAGVGKTAVVEGLALRIAADDVPDMLKGVRILTLDVGLMEAGAGMKGEFENRLKSVIQEIKDAEEPIILFIDEAHTLIGAGGRIGGSDAANLLKPALARGELRTIAATTWPEYKKYFEKDQALTRRFQVVRIDEPDMEATVDILRGLKPSYEKDHCVSVRDDALIAAAVLSRRYITGRMLPDKAVDVLDTAAARVKINLSHPPEALEDLERSIDKVRRSIRNLEEDQRKGAPIDMDSLAGMRSRLFVLEERSQDLKQRWRMERDLIRQIVTLRESSIVDTDQLTQMLQNLEDLQQDDPLLRHEVDPDVVAHVISDWTGIPLGKLLRDHAQAVLNLEYTLASRIRGQEQALDVIAGTLKAATSGLRDPSRPLGCFLLVGPSGVGKTETALALADSFFGDESSIVALNMSEFQERHTVSRLIGSPPGYVGYGEGGLLTEAIRRRPFCVLLLDEAEKANPEVLHLFLQVFDKGTLTDGEGREVDFRNTIIFLTSNQAAATLSGMAGEISTLSQDSVLEAIRPELLEQFKPGLLARLTIVPYYELDVQILAEIAALKLERLAEQLVSGSGMHLTYTPETPLRIAERSLHIGSGARGVEHVLALDVLPRMSQELLERMQQGAPPRAASLGVDDSGGFTLRFGA